MAETKKGNLTNCWYCNVQVPRKLIKQHLKEVHKKRYRNKHKQSPQSQSEKQKFYNQFDLYYDKISDCIDRYLMGEYSHEIIWIFTIMYLIKNCRYTKPHMKIFINNWDEEYYKEKSKKIIKKYNIIESRLLNEDKDEYEEEDEPERHITWEELNSYEPRFGKKYLGYQRREYENSRFGSYPLHDDHSEESDPEGFTNLDY